MELNQDERVRQYLKANFGVDDIRLMYDSLNHLYDNWPGEPLPQEGGELGEVPQDPNLEAEGQVTDAEYQKDTKKAEI